MARYIIEFMFCSGLFVALYKLLIKGRVAHHQARIYLVSALILSVVIPVLELPLYPAQTVYFELPIINTDVQSLSSSTVVGEIAPAVQSALRVDWRDILSMVAWAVYILVFTLNIARFVYRLWVIRSLRLNAQLAVYEDYILAVSERISEPFSFWRTIFMGIRYAGRDREQIIIHELSHIRHHHTAERLAVELLRCVFWFNPFVWLVGNYLVEVQEWEADSDVLSRGYDVYEYRQLIFRQLFGYNTDITCGLNSQLTKNRFLMMTNFKKGKLSFIRLGVAIPMVGAMILAFGSVRAVAVDNTPMPVAQNLPDEEKSTVYISADGKITLNGEALTLEELQAKLEKMRAEKGADTVLTIKADNATKLIAIQGVKDAARQSGVLRVKYLTTENEVNKVLPPIPTEENGIKVVTDITSRVAKHNLLMVCMNARGDIMTTRPDGKEAIVGLDELKSIVKQFIDNKEWVNGKPKQKNPNYSSFRWRDYRVGDETFRYAESDGVVSVETILDVDVEKYLALHSTIAQAFAELRDELAQNHFRKSFESLSDVERKFVTQAIPIKVSEAQPKKLPSKKR